MKFSVVIPVYNTEKFLARCLDSLRDQIDGDYEVIVIDDCSPGNCAEIVRSYGDFVRYIRHERNRSAFQARRTGLAAARGEYIVPVDPDDYLTPETLAKLHETIDRESPDMISYWLDYDNGDRVYSHWCRHPASTVSGADALRELSEHTYFTGVASKAFRRDTLKTAIDELGDVDSLYVNTGDDFLMLVPMLMKSRKVSFLDYAGYRYFVNQKSATFSWRNRRGFERALAQMRQVNDCIRHRANAPDVSLDLRALVEKMTVDIEAWFVQSYRERTFIYRIKKFFARWYGRQKI